MTSPCNTFPPSYDIDAVAGFEGPEKKLALQFVPNPLKPNGFRERTQEQWQVILDLAKCTIISRTSNKHFDSFVLSESSLFVYPYKVVLKTCGTTTLLKTVPAFLELAAEHFDSKPELVTFSRKNYNFPSKQISPHHHFDAETEYLNQYFKGASYVLGDPVGDHWHLYVADMASATSDRAARPTVEIMMSRLDRDVMAKFYKGELSSKETTESTGISGFLPDSISDEVLFEPCGYSVNGLFNDAYYTIHVTPEPQCSFVSFESNIDLACYTALVRRVLDAFKPASFCVALSTERPFATESLFDRDLPGYSLVQTAEQHAEGSFSVSFCAYLEDRDMPPLSQ